jgi:hypothetical protein
MNGIRLAAFAAAALAFASAIAQTDNPYNGAWTISFEGKKTAADVEGAIVVNGDGGTWDLALTRKSPCAGRQYPITVKKASADELVFTVDRAKTLAGCKDSTYTFKRVDDKTMRGELSEGREASLTRK